MTCGTFSSAPRKENSTPTSYHHASTLRKHCDQANYQAAIWRQSLQSCLQIPYPVGHGWSLEEGRLIANWMSGEPAPMAVLGMLSCQCKRRCQLPNCTCLSNGLQRHCNVEKITILRIYSIHKSYL